MPSPERLTGNDKVILGLVVAFFGVFFSIRRISETNPWEAFTVRYSRGADIIEVRRSKNVVFFAFNFYLARCELGIGSGSVRSIFAMLARELCAGFKPALDISDDIPVVDAREGFRFPEHFLFVVFWLKLDLFCEGPHYKSERASYTRCSRWYELIA